MSTCSLPRHLLPFLGSILALSLLVMLPVAAQEEAPPLPPPNPVASQLLPGVSLAQGISEMTGVAISPLLGVSAVAVWRYFRTPAAQRAALPWYCHPWCWGVGISLVALSMLKDVLGTAAPPLIKKPLDFIELFENQFSAIIASAGFVPLVALEMSRRLAAEASPEPAALLVPAEIPLAFIPSLAVAGPLLLIPLCIAGFLIVWLAFHSVNVLVAMSPFGLFDAFLKLFKTAVMALVALSALVNPAVAVFLCLSILVLAVWIAPWAFRLSVFGTVFGLDVLFPSWARARTNPAAPQAFLARSQGGFPTRTYGKLSRTGDAGPRITFRPMLVPLAKLDVPPDALSLSRGLFYARVLHHEATSSPPVTLFILPPRYSGREEEIARHLKIPSVQDGRLRGGIKAIRSWCGEIFALGQTRAEQTQRALP